MIKMNDLNDNFVEQLGVAAYYLSQKDHPYDTLCWMLAERQLIAQQDPIYSDQGRIREKAAQIYFESLHYDVLVYLIAEFDIKLKRK
jgi:hypothetical protein